ncbi:MAG TPA: hypothetical protein PL110_16980 [Candidatus Eremiobacteraeota bacterium]|nr:hypothetical protein [Candidatus Eremiobacteraeota bacterium]
MRKFCIFLIFLLILSPARSSDAISKLEIYPRPVEFSQGDTFFLQAVGRNEEGKVLPLLMVFWSVEPKELGRFSSINTIKTSFTAEKKGKGKLILRCENITCEEDIIIYDTFPPYNDIWPVRKGEM